MFKDKPTITKNEDVIEINYGNRFPMRKNIMSYGSLVFIIVLMLLPSDSNAKIVVVPFCLFISLIMLTSTTGVKINSSKKQFQYYFSVFGISVGKWEKWIGFSCLVLKSSMKKRDRSLTHDFLDEEIASESFKTTELYMMNNSHRKKMYCGSFDTYKNAKEFAVKTSQVFNFPIEKFSPKRLVAKRRR